MNVRSAASGARNLLTSIAVISRQVTQWATIADRAADETKHTDEMVQSLAFAEQLIQDITSQTNLLAPKCDGRGRSRR